MLIDEITQLGKITMYVHACARTFPQSQPSHQRNGKYPLNINSIGVQFHPEKNAFEWKRRIASGLPHTASSIRASQNLANFFVDETRRSCHGFASTAEEDAALIYHFRPQETSVAIDSVFQQQYFFNVTGA